MAAKYPGGLTQHYRGRATVASPGPEIRRGLYQRASLGQTEHPAKGYAQAPSDARTGRVILKPSATQAPARQPKSPGSPVPKTGAMDSQRHAASATRNTTARPVNLSAPSKGKFVKTTTKTPMRGTSNPIHSSAGLLRAKGDIGNITKGTKTTRLAQMASNS